MTVFIVDFEQVNVSYRYSCFWLTFNIFQGNGFTLKSISPVIRLPGIENIAEVSILEVIIFVHLSFSFIASTYSKSYPKRQLHVQS